MRACDYLVDIGPGAGVHGGEIVAAGTIEDIMLTFSSNISISVNEAWTKNRVFYAGTSVMLQGTDNAVFKEEFEGGVTISGTHSTRHIRSIPIRSRTATISSRQATASPSTRVRRDSRTKPCT